MNKTIVDEPEPTYEVTSAEDLARLSRIGRADMGDLLDIGEDNKVSVDLKKVTEQGLLAGVKKLVLDENGGLVEIEMFDKVAALEAIGRYHKLW